MSQIIYSEIIKYASFAQENMTSTQQQEVADIKKSAKLIFDAHEYSPNQFDDMAIFRFFYKEYIFLFFF